MINPIFTYDVSNYQLVVRLASCVSSPSPPKILTLNYCDVISGTWSHPQILQLSLFHDAFFSDSEKAGGSSIDRGFSHPGCGGENLSPSLPCPREPWNPWPYLWEVASSESSSLAACPPVLMGPSDDLDSTGSEGTPFQPGGGLCPVINWVRNTNLSCFSTYCVSPLTGSCFFTFFVLWG